MQKLGKANIVKKSVTDRLFLPVSNAPLIIFRIIFGFLLAYHFSSSIVNGAVYNNFIQPAFTFTYIGFEFLQPLPGNGMYYYFGLMVLLAVMIMLGAWYRIAIIGFSILWTILYLMQKADYNNHYYLMLLLCWIMAVLPANRLCAVDVKRKAVPENKDCSYYCLWIFMAQVAIVYFFAAISKIDSDWFSGKFIEIQFSRLRSHHLLGIFYGQKWFRLLVCYGGFIFDLLIVPLLLWKKTRNYAFIFSILFHLFNSFTFRIGLFPYLSIALNLFFLDSGLVNRLFFGLHQSVQQVKNEIVSSQAKKKVLYLLGIYLFFQAIIPTRSWFFPGNVFWSEEGYRMSWKMMMRTKSGKIHFKITDPTTHSTWIEDPAKKFNLSQIMWLSISPDIIWQYAQRLKKEYAEKGINNVQVYAIGTVRLNRSNPMPMVDTTVDLASVKWKPFRHSEWVTAFKDGD